MSNIYFKTKTAVNADVSMFSSGLTLVEAAGFEPVAFASRTQRSTKLSHIPFSANIIIIVQLHNFGKYFFRFAKDFKRNF